MPTGFPRNRTPVHHKHENGVSVSSFYVTLLILVNPVPDLVRIHSVTVIIDSKVISGSKVWETYLNMTYINFVLLYYGRILKKNQGIGGKGKGIRNETDTDTKLYLYK
jgi:hypothetical protein